MKIATPILALLLVEDPFGEGDRTPIVRPRHVFSQPAERIRAALSLLDSVRRLDGFVPEGEFGGSHF